MKVLDPELNYVLDDVGVSAVRSAAGKKAKAKGANFERVIASKLTGWWGTKFFRTPLSGGSRLKDDYNLAGDVSTPDQTFPFHIECKNQECLGGLHNIVLSENHSVWKWWEQATKDCPTSKVPLLIFTRAHLPVFVMMDNWMFGFLHRQADEEVKNIQSTFRLHVKTVTIILLETLLSMEKKHVRTSSEEYLAQKSGQAAGV